MHKKAVTQDPQHVDIAQSQSTSVFKYMCIYEKTFGMHEPWSMVVEPAMNINLFLNYFRFSTFYQNFVIIDI